MGFIEVTWQSREHCNSNWNRTYLLRSRSSPKRRRFYGTCERIGRVETQQNANYCCTRSWKRCR